VRSSRFEVEKVKVTPFDRENLDLQLESGVPGLKALDRAN
jgi:hypothetical protein